MTNLKDQKVVVIGYGVEGKSTAQFLKGERAIVTVVDQNSDLKIEGYDTILGDKYLANLDDFDLVVPSPGIKHTKIKTTKPIVSPTQLFLERFAEKTIGVTGTKGKGTTSTLIAKLLEAAGQKVQLGGNIGTPALDLLPHLTKEDWVVLELSSFQLYDITISPHIAVVLMIEPDHMDWHPDMEDYVSAKTNITRFQTENDAVIYFGENNYSRQIAEASLGKKVAYMSKEGAFVRGENIEVDGQTIMPVLEVGLIGPHNLQNVCAALTAVRAAAPSAFSLQPSATKLAKVLREFRGLEHRLEFVRELDGVKYYNDSFSVNPISTAAAMKSFIQPKVVIMGGSKRGITFETIAEEVKNVDIHKVILVGETAGLIEEEFKKIGFENYEKSSAQNMDKIVNEAKNQAQPGDIVLLSPGCPSFDMFENYEDRGLQFKKVVQELK